MNTAISLLSLILGTIFGSFYNVVIYRLPRKLSIARGFSFCPSCEKRIMPLELIPIVSYIFLQGRCSKCKSKIHVRYPLIEFLSGLTFLLAYLRFELTIATLVAICLGSFCLIIAMIDIDTMEIYDRFHLLIIGLAIIHISQISTLGIINHVLGFFVVSIPLYIIAILTNGIGGGDIKLMAASGLLLGLEATLVAFFIASILAGFVAVILLATKRTHKKSMIAFGPFLCFGIFTAYLVGNELIKWYLNLFGI